MRALSRGAERRAGLARGGGRPRQLRRGGDGVARAGHPRLHGELWCPPCKQLKPLLQRAVADADGKLKLAVLDTDAHPQLAQQLQVRSLPTVFGLARGELVDQFAGLVPQPQLDEFLRKLTASAPDP